MKKWPMILKSSILLTLRKWMVSNRFAITIVGNSRFLFAGVQFLATASRDRMVHVFANSEDSYQPIQSLPDHSAAVTAVGFTEQEGHMQLLSAGADKSIIYHALEVDEVRGGGGILD